MRHSLTTPLPLVILLLTGSACSDGGVEDLDQGPTIFLEDNPLAVGPDESVYVVANVEGQSEIYRVDPDTASPTLAFTLASSRDVQLFFPEGRVLLLHRSGGQHELQIRDPDTFETTTIQRSGTLYEAPRFSDSGRHLVVTTDSFRLAPFQLIDTRTLATVPLPEEGDASAALWLPGGEQLMMLAFYGQPLQRVRVMVWEVTDAIFTTSLFPDKLLDIDLEGLQLQEGLDFRWIGLSPDGTQAAIPVFGLDDHEADPPEEPDAGNPTDLDAEADAEEEDAAEDAVEIDVPEEEDAQPEDVEEEDVAVDAEDDDAEPLEDTPEVEEEPSEPDPPPAMAQPHLLLLDLEAGTWRVVPDAMGPARFTPGGGALLAQRQTDAGISLLRIDPVTLDPTPIPLPIDVPFAAYESVSEAYALMSTARPSAFVIGDLALGQGRSVEVAGNRRPELIERPAQDQIWFIDRGLHRLDLSEGSPSKAILDFEPRHIGFLPQRDLIVVDSPASGEVVFIDAASGRIARRAPVIEEATPDDCLTKFGAAPISGRWAVTGQGERASCENPALDTDRFDLGAALDVALSPGADEARATIALGSPREGFELTGAVLGVCVNFTTADALQTGDRVELTWSGTWSDEAQAIVGTFQGSGPQSCVTQGAFTVRIQ